MNCVPLPTLSSLQFGPPGLACLRRCKCGGVACEARREFGRQGMLLSELGRNVWESQLCVGEGDGLGGLPQERQPAFA